jgi:Domain of unknown function (DUF4175)
MAADLDPRSGARLTRALWAARAVMLWEQGARIWAPWLLAAAALAVAALWGVFDGLGPLGRLALLAAATLTALIFSVRGAMTVRWPGREATRERLEADSRLVHAPLAALEDAPAAGDPRLWELHRKASAAALAEARVGRPKAGLAAADPFALRWALTVAAVLALWARGPERVDHVAQVFAPSRQLAGAHNSLAALHRAFGGWFAAKDEAHGQARASVQGEPARNLSADLR